MTTGLNVFAVTVLVSAFNEKDAIEQVESTDKNGDNILDVLSVADVLVNDDKEFRTSEPLRYSEVI